MGDFPALFATVALVWMLGEVACGWRWAATGGRRPASPLRWLLRGWTLRLLAGLAAVAAAAGLAFAPVQHLTLEPWLLPFSVAVPLIGGLLERDRHARVLYVRRIPWILAAAFLGGALVATFTARHVDTVSRYCAPAGAATLLGGVAAGLALGHAGRRGALAWWPGLAWGVGSLLGWWALEPREAATTYAHGHPGLVLAGLVPAVTAAVIGHAGDLLEQGRRPRVRFAPAAALALALVLGAGMGRDRLSERESPANSGSALSPWMIDGVREAATSSPGTLAVLWSRLGGGNADSPEVLGRARSWDGAVLLFWWLGVMLLACAVLGRVPAAEPAPGWDGAGVRCALALALGGAAAIWAAGARVHVGGGTPHFLPLAVSYIPLAAVGLGLSSTCPLTALASGLLLVVGFALPIYSVAPISEWNFWWTPHSARAAELLPGVLAALVVAPLDVGAQRLGGHALSRRARTSLLWVTVIVLGFGLWGAWPSRS